MKRSIGSLLSALVTLSLALGANASTWKGSGVWKSSDEKNGSYDVVADIQADGDKVTIAQTLNFDDARTMSFAITIQKYKNDFFALLNENGEKVGGGYCFEHGEPGYKICHSSQASAEGTVELTVEITPDAIYRMGSKTKEGSPTIAWSDSLELQPEDEMMPPEA